MKEGCIDLLCSTQIMIKRVPAATLNRMADGIVVGVLYAELIHQETEEAMEKPTMQMAEV